MQSENLFKKISATYAAMKMVVTTKKWANLVILSTTINIQYLPNTLRKPVMKSMEMLSHFGLEFERDVRDQLDEFSPVYFAEMWGIH